jgi:C-terminal processing protease CtpA/Prc
MDAVNHGFDKVERLAGNVGLLELRTFSTIDKTAARIDGAMAFLADTDALIIDLRYNAGGHAASVQYLISYLLSGEKPILLNTMKWRSAAGNQPVTVTRKVSGQGLEQQSWTYQALPGPHYDKKPVFVVISEITASAAESFTYALQALKRVTVVGGTSAGAANPGGTDRLTSHFQIFIPRGRPEHPLTHANWEGVGIKPDVPASFENAQKVAYIHALEEIDKSRTYVGPEPLQELINDHKKQLEKVSKSK